MSPEQVRGHDADHRTDIFSLGAILHEMLSGRRAFRRESHVETMNAILKEDPVELGKERDAPPALVRIVRRCLEKNAEERFQSARDLAFAIEAISDVNKDVVEGGRRDEKIAERSIAVLPFTNMSADPENEYFSDGISRDHQRSDSARGASGCGSYIIVYVQGPVGGYRRGRGQAPRRNGSRG